MTEPDQNDEPIIIESERSREADEGTRSDGLVAMLIVGLVAVVLGIIIVATVMV